MLKVFDPYHRWLGIPSEDQPPNHYRLLGIPIFESEPEVIDNSADRQMAHVRQFQSVEYANMARKLLNEIATARVCLLDVGKRREYDSGLRQTFRRVEPKVVPPIASRKTALDSENGQRQQSMAVASGVGSNDLPRGTEFFERARKCQRNHRYDDASGAAAFGRCVQRMTVAVDPNWTEELYNWMNKQMPVAVYTIRGAALRRKGLMAKFSTVELTEKVTLINFAIGIPQDKDPLTKPSPTASDSSNR